MIIYRIRPAPGFHTLFPMGSDPTGLISSFGTDRKWDSWISAFGSQGPMFGISEPSSSETGNFFDLSPGVLVHDMRVADEADRLGLFQSDIEYLPGRLKETGEPLCIQNVMGCYNCLDRERSLFSSVGEGSFSSIETHVFIPGRILDSTVFKIPETRLDAIYALSGRGQDDFFKFYHEHGFKGLVFDEVWRS